MVPSASFAIIPGELYVFDHRSGDSRVDLRIVFRCKLRNNIKIVLTNIGFLAFDFASSELKDFESSGICGEEESNREDLSDEYWIKLQRMRLRIATFVIACIVSVNNARSNRLLSGMLLPNVEDIFGYVDRNDTYLYTSRYDDERFVRFVDLRRKKLHAGELKHWSISVDDVKIAFELMDRFLESSRSYNCIDPVSMIVLNYQAMVLHGQHHAGASVAISAMIVEALIEEIIYAVGLVEGVPGRILGLDTKYVHRKMSRKRAKDLGFGGAVAELVNIHLIDHYLEMRIKNLRNARNSLMHDGIDASSQQSGEALTTIRDLFRLCSGENLLDINTGWGYRAFYYR